MDRLKLQKQANKQQNINNLLIKSKMHLHLFLINKINYFSIKQNELPGKVNEFLWIRYTNIKP